MGGLLHLFSTCFTNSQVLELKNKAPTFCADVHKATRCKARHSKAKDLGGKAKALGFKAASLGSSYLLTL